MADYEDLDTIIGEMKRAAIDCWMADQSFYPAWGNEGTYCKWHWAPYQYFRPAEDGSGGGDGVGYNVSCAAQFDQIRAAIDTLVDKWKGLPDGTLCSAPQQQVNGTAALLGTSGGSASVENGGEIGTANDTVHEVVINKMAGAFRSPFLDKYYTQFSIVNSGLGQANVILEANYAAQAAMWPAARSDVATICDAARVAWAAQAEKTSAANTTLQLTVVAAVAGAVSSVVTAGSGTVAAVTALSGVALAANTALAAVTADTDVSGGSYDEILGSLEDALNNLNQSLYTQEQALDKMLTDAGSTMRQNAADYDLDAFALGTYPISDGTMQMDKTDASMVSGNMGRIEDALGDAKAKLGSAPDASPTPREDGIGWSSTGTHAAASDLYALTARCLELTTAEYRRGHDLFDATVDDFFSVDAHAEQTVKNLVADEALTADVEA